MSILLADIDATCAALGYTDGQRYHAEPDALQGLKHLIWILRRDLDNHEYRRHLGHAKVLQTDLVYMLPDYVSDNDYADVLIRLLVILTSPTLLLFRDGPPKDNHGRKIYLELIDILQGYKSAFTRDHLWSALFGKLKQSLAIDWALRSEEQNLLIERILVLIRNVLQVPANPEAECRADNDASLHDQVIWALHKSGMLDLVLFIISSSDEHQFHLHCLEILCLLYREQTAENLADASLQRSVSEKLRDEQELLAARRREKQRLTAKPPAGRHSRFGGTYVIRNLKSVSDRDIICHQPLERVVSIDFDREKQQQKRSYRHISEESQVMRRSAFSVRLCLREYCIEILNSAYNTLVRQVRHLLQRSAHTNNHDDSFLLWIIRFFMEFNRLNAMKLELVSESLSVQCFHWVLTRMQHDMDMIVTDKQHARLWAKRLNVALQTFRELLHSLLALQKLQDDNACALFNMLLNNVCYVLEYRETILHLLMNYNETHSTKAFLRDVVETANIFIKIMEKFCKDEVVVQEKKRTKKRTNKKSTKLNKTRQETEEELSNKWVEMANEMSDILTNGLQMAEEEQPIPFDAASEKNIDDQRDDCLIRIHKLLHNHKLDHAIALLRSAREVWPENDVFGSATAAPEDELLLLREIFMHNITTADESSQNNESHENAAADNQAVEGYDDADEEEYDEIEDMGTVEKTFKFEDFLKRLLNAKIVRACVVVLTDWEKISTKSLKAAVTILYRIAYGCSCPAMLYQAKLFRIFQQVFNAGRDAHHEELRRLGVYVVRKFVKTAPNNPKIFAELLFYKSIKEANELESGYCDVYESGTKGSWTEEQEAELRFLFEENQRNPASDKDVIDWLLDNLIDKTRTRRGVLKKLKEMNLMFKAPTKKSTASSQSSKNLWKPEEDEELHNLYSQNRMNNDCLEKILQEFQGRRNKQQILKRLLQLGIIADKSEILPEKPKKPKSKQNKEKVNERELMEGGQVEQRPKKTKKPQKVRTPLHVGTVKDLLARIDEEQFKEALEWLRECLQEAAEDPDEAIEEDDGVPLVPLQELQKQAMEDENFKKLLVALGIQPPVFGMENYWRIPTYLNKADLKLRASIIAGDEITQNEEESEELEKASNTEDDSDRDEVQDVNNDSENNESEDDYLEMLNKRKTSNYLEQKREKMKTLMFSKSDDETEERPPLKRIPNKQENAEKKINSEESEDDLELINKIKKKLDKKKRNYDLSSEEEEDENIFDKLKNKFHENLFDQVKGGVTSTTTTSYNKKEKTNNNADNLNNEKDEYSTDNLLQFNSEDYRKRLADLGDSSEEENIEKMPELKSNLSNNRQRRANVIDSDSEEEEEDDENMQSTSKTADKISHQENIVIADDMTHKKRRRPSQGAETADNDQHNVKSNDNDETVDDGDEDYQPIRKVTAATILDKSVENPAKRRRVAVIDDSDEDDN